MRSAILSASMLVCLACAQEAPRAWSPPPGDTNKWIVIVGKGGKDRPAPEAEPVKDPPQEAPKQGRAIPIADALGDPSAAGRRVFGPVVVAIVRPAEIATGSPYEILATADDYRRFVVLPCSEEQALSYRKGDKLTVAGVVRSSGKGVAPALEDGWTSGAVSRRTAAEAIEGAQDRRNMKRQHNPQFK